MSTKQLQISDLPQNVFKALCDSLDINSSWRLLVASLSDTHFKLRDVDREECSMEIHGRLDGSPSRKLLHKLDSKGMSKETLSYYLGLAKLERPLKCIREHEPLVIKEQPHPNLEIPEGMKLELKCTASGFPYPEYVWFKGDKEVWCCRDGPFVIQSVRKENEGVYTCRVQHLIRSGWKCEMSESCKVTVKKCNNFKPFNPVDQLDFTPVQNMPEFPQIMVQPTSQTNSLRGVVTFRVRAQHHSLTLSYQWYHKSSANGFTPIRGANWAEYRIEDVDKSNEGEYQVKVYSQQNRCVEVNSNVVTLTIINTPNLFYATDKVALILGNSNYRSYGNILPAVKEDMTHTNQLLEKMGFKVICLLDLTLLEMQHYLEIFCSMVAEGVYVLFYCIGHGFLHDHKHYLIPWDASQGVALNESLCIERCIERIQNQSPIMLMALFDICRKNAELCSPPTPTLALPLPKSRPNQVIIYAASLNEQSYEVRCHMKPRGLFNECLLDVLKDNKFTISQLYGELKRRFKDCPFDIHNDQYAQHPEMTINLEDPDRSLWDPVDQMSLNEISMFRGQFWQRIQTLPSNLTIQIENYGNFHLSFHKFFSNVLALETEFFPQNVDNSDVVMQLDISEDGVDPILLPIVRKKCADQLKQSFLFANLQRLKKKMTLSFAIRSRKLQNGKKKDEKNTKYGDLDIQTDMIEAGFPLISSQQ